jgi:uncharacterized protein (DUF927 family)
VDSLDMDIASLMGLLYQQPKEQVIDGGLLGSNVFDAEKYKSLTSDNQNLVTDYRPLNFDNLLKKGAFRVTHLGLGENQYNPDPNAGFSIVSAANDAIGSSSKTWKDNPMAYDVVRKMFTENPQNIGAHKYLQIIQSAKDMGLNEKDIFLK